MIHIFSPYFVDVKNRIHFKTFVEVVKIRENEILVDEKRHYFQFQTKNIM